jgi:hypothetical protein
MLLQFTVIVTCVWAGVDNAWEQEKLQARKMLAVGAARAKRSPTRQVHAVFGGCRHFFSV